MPGRDLQFELLGHGKSQIGTQKKNWKLNKAYLGLKNIAYLRDRAHIPTFLSVWLSVSPTVNEENFQEQNIHFQ